MVFKESIIQFCFAVAVTVPSLSAIAQVPLAPVTQVILKSPATINVDYTNVVDNSGGSGFSLIRLHSKKDAGAWIYTGVSSALASGSLPFSVSGSDGTFLLSAEVIDQAGNSSTLGQAPSLVTVILDSTAPIAATVTGPATSSAAAFALSYSGAADTLSGVANVALWSKKSGGIWADTGLSANTTSGTFNYTAATDGTYYFAAVVTDAAGNSSATPSGNIGAVVTVAIDLCPSDPNKTAPGLCGCDVIEDTGDSDGDGIINCLDNDGPTGTLSTTAPTITKTSPITITVTFNRAVTGFIASDLIKTNATVSNFAGSGASYSFSLTPTAQGLFSVYIPQGAALDAVNSRLSVASTVLSRTFDNVAPTLTLSSVTSAATSVTPIVVTATFSESVTGFATNDLALTNATVTGFSGSGASYTFNLVPIAQGNVSVTVAANAAQDAAANSSGASIVFSRVFDTTKPVAPNITVSVP